jgi:hypothetical protein
MNRFLDRLLWHLSSGLESPERLAVIGDPDESGRSFARAALDVLGLLMRRHAALGRLATLVDTGYLDCPGSSSVNRRVVGSSPTSGAI